LSADVPRGAFSKDARAKSAQIASKTTKG